MRPQELARYEALRVYPKRIPAECWNAVRLALRRHGRPLSIELRGMRAVSCELDEAAWVVWGPPHYGAAPLMAWTAFARPHAALHLPVSCELRLYHLHAGLLMGPALEAVEQTVRILLRGAERR